MTLAGRKRPFSAVEGEWELSSEPAKRQRKEVQFAEKVEIKTTSKQKASVEPLKYYTAATFKPPVNPQATFQGLPAELRLQIYDYLCDSTIIHVHHHPANPQGISSAGARPDRFTWTPCRSPSSKSPLLCANPKWSGMCPEEDRCTYKVYAPPEPIGFWGLAASDKATRNETQELFLARTVVSMHPRTLVPWLNHLEKHAPRQLDNLRRVTLAGPNFSALVTQNDLQVLRNRVPNLEAVGFQCQDPLWRWVSSYANGIVKINGQAWRSWDVLNCMKRFDASVTVAMEALVWRTGAKRFNQPIIEQQVAIRLIRLGKEEGAGHDYGWSDEDIEVEIEQPGKMISGKRTAKWRQWWRGKQLKSFA